MHTVEILRWQPGFMKVSHSQLLQKTCGYSLQEAKAATDAVLEGRTIRVQVVSREEAEELLFKLTELGAVARMLTSEHNAV